ncbi:hypothetical protein B0H13DRAFT_607910 [Mycena leptocephala]|nr:hypothetical protein B0H13DRAFT_607910 [Mycena leptocephala]
MTDNRPPKRRREDTEDGEVVAKTSNPASRRSAAAPASAQWSFKGQLPPQWRRIFDEAAEAGDKIPPPTCITRFVELHAECLSDFRDSQQVLQKAISTLSKHEMHSSNGAIPTTVSNNLKFPHVQLVKGAPGAGDDAEVSAEKVNAEKKIAEAAGAVTSYLGKLYANQVTLCRQLVNVPAASTVFSHRLEAYAKPIITAGGGDDDTVWDTVITALTNAIADELQNLNFEFVAVLDREAEAKEAKATAVITARADAEMADATKPVKELVMEVGAQLELKLTKLINEKLPTTPIEASSSSKATSSKPVASSSKTKTDKVPSNTAADTKQEAVPSKRAMKKASRLAASGNASDPKKPDARTKARKSKPSKPAAS